MDPITVIEGVVTVVGAVHSIVQALREYKLNLKAIDDLALYVS